MFSPGRVFFLFCSSLLINNVAAIAPGLLGIQINDGLARGPAHKIVLESIATIRGFDLWNDSQIVDLAFVAHQDMINAHTAANVNQETYPGCSKGKPFVTSVLRFGTTAYIASSAMGGAYLYLPNGKTTGDVSRFTELDPAHPCNGPLHSALRSCQINSFNGSGHRTGASCGEPMAILAFCATNNQASFQNSNAAIVTIAGRPNTPGGPFILPPCGGPSPPGPALAYQGEWGCHDLLMAQELGIRVIPAATTRSATNVDPNDITVTHAIYP